ncbi:Plug domain-containing protein [Opitutus sp. ER46]|uniref:Plug domain-containing protein n=1 Tax=Opitutus sp. ER46 TaxID=2161864 RepID=UPI000D300082|nr:Plug domain-containing protein [Opitutus sp. ER46]PTX98404.1 hypothetical protein DB354_03805 [Opitutus sp. ER46]
MTYHARYAALPALLLAAAATAFGQTAPTPNAAAAAATKKPVPITTEDDTVQLSPFTVSTDRDTGFVAASSLAGGRLATDLKDTPVAYSVITRDFIDALSLENITEAADWAPNSVRVVSTVGAGLGNDQSNDPGSFNVRGSGGGRGMRNFFTYKAPNDAYAVERFDIGRGPNAVLFGNGSLGGVPTTMTKQARFDQTFAELSQSVGSWSNFRTTADVNRSFGKKFAARLALVHVDSDGWRDRYFSRIKSAFLTLSYKLTPETTVRVEGEYGETARNSTFNNLTDRLSGWDGKTTFSGLLAKLPSNANSIGVSRRPAGYQVWDPFSGLNAVMNYQNDPMTMGGGENRQVPIAGYLQGQTLPGFNSNNSNIHYSFNIPERRFDNAISGSHFVIPSRTFSLATDWPVLTERFRDLQFTIDHRIKNIYIQLAADANRTDQRTYTMDVRSSNQMYIDINNLLPNGAPNPHVLYPYGDASLRRNINTADANSARLAVGSFKDLNKWGFYTWNLMGGYSEYTFTNSAQNRSIAQNADHRRWGASSNEMTATDIIRVRRYWNEDSRPFNMPETIRYINPQTGLDTTISPIWAQENDRADSLTDKKSSYTHGVAALNAKYFDGRLVFLGALRADKYYNTNRQQIRAGDYDPDSWDGVTGILRPDAPEDYTSLTYLPKNAAGQVTGPAIAADTRPRDGNGNRLAQYANDRFKDDYNAPDVRSSKLTKNLGTIVHVTKWASPYFNYAETYNPPATVQLLDSSFPPATVAKGIDMGIRFELFNQRINLNVLYYANEEINSSVSAPNNREINYLLGCNAVGDTSEGGRNIRGLQGVPAICNDLRDREAKGYEVEVVANVTKNLRLLFNVGLPKVWEKNSYRMTKAYLENNWEILKQVTIDAGCTIDANDDASIDTTIAAELRPDAGTASSNWDTLVAARKNLITGKRIVQDQPSVNLYADYNIPIGPLKGLRVGGGVQYRGKQIIGYKGADTIVDPANPLLSIDDPTVDAYSPLFAPDPYYIATATMSYTWRLKNRRSVSMNLRINNLFNDQGPIYAASTVLRPKNGDYTSPARETVPNNYALKEPVSFKLTMTYRH